MSRKNIGIECFFNVNAMIMKRIGRPLNEDHETCFKCRTERRCSDYVSLDSVRRSYPDTNLRIQGVLDDNTALRSYFI